MKIKQKNLVRLDELIKHCIENDKFGNEGTFWSITGKVKVMVYKDDVVIEDDFMVCNIIETLFVITEEVEITEEMELKQFVVIYKNDVSGQFRNMNIKELFERCESVYGHGIPIKFIYLQNEDGSIGELIWSKERGLID